MSSRIELDRHDRGTVEYLRGRLQQIEAQHVGDQDRTGLITSLGRTLAVASGLLKVLDEGVASGE